MKHSGLPFFSFLLILAAAITLACGSAASSSHTLKSVAVIPATADAQNYPGGLVPFVATGYYSTKPSPVGPLTAHWGACSQNAPTSAVTISSTGVAQCAAGAPGTYTVFAAEATNCNLITACGGGCQVSGYAQLTCP